MKKAKAKEKTAPFWWKGTNEAPPFVGCKNEQEVLYDIGFYPNPLGPTLDWYAFLDRLWARKVGLA